MITKKGEGEEAYRGAFWQMHLAIFFWGFTGVLGELINLHEGALVWYRMLLASFFLFGYLFYYKIDFHIPKHLWKRVSLIGFLLAIHWVCFYGAINLSNVSITLCCLASTALFTAIIEPILLKSKLNLFDLFAGILVLIGIFFIFYTETNYWLGIIVGIISAIISAIFTILNKPLSGKVNPVVVSAWELLIGWLGWTVLLPFYLYFTQTNNYFPSFEGWFYLLIMAIFCTSIACVLALKSLQHVSSFTMNLNLNLEPVYGILLAFFILKENENLNEGFYVGASIIFGSLFFHSYFQSRLNK